MTNENLPPYPPQPVPGEPAKQSEIPGAPAMPGAYPGAPGTPGVYPVAPGMPGAYAGSPGMLPAPPRSDTLAIVGLILSVVVFPVGLVMSIVALVRAKKQGARRGIAIAGVVVGAVVGIGAIAATVGIVLFARTIAGPAGAASDVANSFWTGSCADFQNSTTPAFRDSISFSDCTDFESQATSFRDQATDHDFSVTSTNITNGTATVEGRETFVSNETGEKVSNAVTIHLVHQGGDWLADSIE